MDDHEHRARNSKALTAKKKREYNGGFTAKHVRVKEAEAGRHAAKKEAASTAGAESRVKSTPGKQQQKPSCKI